MKQMISIIIPAYNEAQTLDIFLKNLLEFIEKLLGKKFTQVSDAIINRELPNSEENISAILPKLDTPAPPEPLEISKAEKLKKFKQQLEEDSRIED